MSTVLIDKAAALCVLQNHDLMVHGPTQDDPGAVVCYEEGCISTGLLGLWSAAACLREARAHLDSCDCESAATCTCSFDYLRWTVGKAEADVDKELAVLLKCCFLDPDEAEATLAGVDH